MQLKIYQLKSMSKFRIQVSLKTHSGSTTCTTEVYFPDHIDGKLGNSNFKNEVISALEAHLPVIIAGADWRKQGYKVEGFNSPVKIG
jgi:hypothetical protein